MKKLILSIAALGAALFTLGTAQAATPNYGGSPLQVRVGCTPLSASQTAAPGSTQRCLIKVMNYGAYTLEDVTISRDSANTLVSRTAYNSPALSCVANTCAPIDLAPGQQVFIEEVMTFNSNIESRYRTRAFGVGTEVIVRPGKATLRETAYAMGMENSTLP